MKKVVIILGVVVVSVWVGYKIFIHKQMKEIGIFSDTKPTIDDVIVVDSVEIGEKWIYWFCYDLGKF